MTHTHRAALKNRRHTGLSADYRQRQKGLGMVSIFLIAAVAIFFLTAAFKVGPSYAEFWTIQKIAEDTAAKADLLRGTKGKVYQNIQRGFTQNNLWDAKAEERITLAKDKQRGMSVTVDYESRTNLFGNIYVVTKFHKVAGNSAK